LKQQLRILAVAVHESVRSFAAKQLSAACFDVIMSADEFYEKSGTWSSESYDIVMSGLGWGELDANELAQNLKMTFRNLPLLFVAHDSEVQNHTTLKKNGFEECFYLPMDANILGSALRAHERTLTGQTKQRLLPVAVLDLRPGEILDFEINIFLPANQKYIKLNHRGSAIEERHLNKFKQKSISHVYIDEEQLPLYFKFVASQMKSWTTDSVKMKMEVRKLFHDLLSPVDGDFEGGRSLIDHASQITSAFVNSRDVLDIHQDLLVQTGSQEGGLYEISQKTATIAGLLSLGTGRGKPDEVVMAALFADLSHSKIAPDCSDEELLHTHPAASLQILASKRMFILPPVREAIMQHHERADGKGYPEGLTGYKIGDIAQLISFASQLEVLTRIVPGKPRLSIPMSFEAIAKTGSIRQDLLNDIKALVIPKQETNPAVRTA
jgi:hypothetical protein